MAHLPLFYPLHMSLFRSGDCGTLRASIRILAYFDEAIERLVKHRERLEAAPALTSAHYGAASRQGQERMAEMAMLQQLRLGSKED